MFNADLHFLVSVVDVVLNMKTEQFPTIVNGIKYQFIVWGDENMWSANAYDSKLKCVAFTDGKGSDEVIIELVKKIESNGK